MDNDSKTADYMKMESPVFIGTVAALGLLLLTATITFAIILCKMSANR